MFEYLIITTDVVRGKPESKPMAIMSWKSVISTMPHLSSQQTWRSSAPVIQ